MKLKRLISCGLVGILTGVGILMNAKVSSAEDKSVGVLTFPDENKNNNKVGGYDKTWNAKMDGREYTISNGNNNNWSNINVEDYKSFIADDLLIKIHEINPNADIVPTIFRPHPVDDISNKNILFATTAPESVQHLLKDYLEENFNCNVVAISSHLSNRPLLQRDIEENIDNIDCMLTELKAAAVDVATKDALNKGLEVVYCDNIPIAINDEYDLDKSIMNIVYEAKESFNKKD